MSTLPSSEPQRRQPPTVWTVMLLLSMIFMLIAVIAIFIELNRYQPELWNTGSARPSVQASAAPLLAPRLL